MPKPDKPVVGFDLGGTKMLSAIAMPDNSLVGRTKKRTASDHDAEEIVKRICKSIDKSLADANLKKTDIGAIGIGCPGPVDLEKGRLQQTPNMALGGFPLRKTLESEFGVPVVLENDVNAGTYGEFCFGAAKGFRHVVGIFPGTGIGGGLVLNGQLYHGAHGGAGEIGHMIINVGGALCGCGQYGCLEAHASRLSLSRDAAALAFRGQAPSVESQAGTDLAQMRSKVLREAIDDGDKAVITLVRRAAEFLGIGMANVVNILNPEIIVLGGGLVEALPADCYLKVAERSMRQHAMPLMGKRTKVAAATLGDDAVVLGAAQLARDYLKAKDPS